MIALRSILRCPIWFGSGRTKWNCGSGRACFRRLGLRWCDRIGPGMLGPYLIFLAGCGLARDEAAIRKALASGSVALPPGVIEIHAELALPDGARDVEIRGAGSTLRAAHDFDGRDIFTSQSGSH